MTRIGVTGHRFLSDLDRVINGVDIGLTRIESTFPQPYIVHSSLAEGADRIVVQRALAKWKDCQLEVYLPLPIDRYLSNFQNQESILEFERLFSKASKTFPPPFTQNDQEAYLETGKSMLMNIDVLFTIWDGLPAQGMGGTGDIVGLAREEGLPIIWIHAGNRQFGTTQAISLDGNQGRVTTEAM